MLLADRGWGQGEWVGGSLQLLTPVFHPAVGASRTLILNAVLGSAFDLLAAEMGSLLRQRYLHRIYFLQVPAMFRQL